MTSGPSISWPIPPNHILRFRTSHIPLFFIKLLPKRRFSPLSLSYTLTGLQYGELCSFVFKVKKGNSKGNDSLE